MKPTKQEEEAEAEQQLEAFLAFFAAASSTPESHDTQHADDQP